MFEELISLVRREQVSLFIGKNENPIKMIALRIYQTFLLMKSI